ncbi:asparaginase [uncultured Albimonas sp.]|uniref:asparaginase n=1 Tax=uncultured Albimonas sp. TaxID=1331701 RepID=UPI0030EB2897|tara:strand:- start:518 stop:1567 length:1050 start_codon:yes stop_codon:yes gene_type:complete
MTDPAPVGPAAPLVDPSAPGFSEVLVEAIRGDLLESVHRGAIAICTPSGEVVQAWGDPERVIYPRSSCKMLQALPLVESGAAADAGLRSEQLALACASHNGAAIHSTRVAAWLEGLGLSEADLRCGPQEPADLPARDDLIRACACPDQTHNNCSGKHAGFLTLNRRLGGGAEYVEVDHPVQRAAREAMAEMTGDPDLGYGIDGCSAPNFATTLRGFATSMARMARPAGLGPAREAAARALVEAMMAHPELVAGEGRACTGMMRAMAGRAAIKTGAEGVFGAILPGLGLGVALKIDDGGTRASECAMAAILVRLGVAEAGHPEVASRLNPPQSNRRGLRVGEVRPAAALG